MLFGLNPYAPRSETATGQLPALLDRLPWPRLLMWLMRALSVAWMIKGLMHWALILGFPGAGGPFEDLSLMQQTTTGLFAVFDVVAGVGLWMVAGWGTVVWLMATLGHVTLALIIPRAASLSQTAMLVHSGLVLVFLLTVWAALRQSPHENPTDAFSSNTRPSAS
jgi:Family of unknown function (DUF6163)